MLGALELASHLLAGVLLASRLDRLAPIDRLAIGAAIGLALLLWLPVPFAVALGLWPGTVVASVVALAIGAAARGVGRARADLAVVRDALRRDPGARGVAIALALIAAFLAWLFHTHVLRDRDGALHSAGVSWTDLALHTSFTLSFVERDNLHPPEYPTFPGFSIGYPFLPDLMPAGLVRMGWSLRAAFAVPSWIACVVFLVLAWRVLRTWTGSRRAAGIALALFLLPGGLGFLPVMRAVAERGWAGLALNATLMVNMEDDSQSVCYGNIVGNLLLATRGASFGMAIGAAVLLLLAVDGDGRVGRLAVAGALTGALPLVHTHTFLAASLVAAVALAPGLLRDRRGVVAFALPFALLALPQVWWIWSRHVSHSTEFLYWYPAFPRRCPSPFAWVVYWVRNAGLFFLALPLGWLAAGRPLRMSTLALLLLFPIANMFSFTPGAHDNAKLFAWFHLGAAALLGGFLAKLAASPRARAAAAVLGFFCCLSGALAIVYETRDEAELFSREDVELARAVHDATDVDAILVTSQALHHPIPAISGRRVLMGPRVLLRMHGIPFDDRQRDIAEIYDMGPGARDALERGHVDWVVVGPRERAQFSRLNEPAIAAIAKERVVVGSSTLYRMR
jgi:hypothetical protein